MNDSDKIIALLAFLAFGAIALAYLGWLAYLKSQQATTTVSLEELRRAGVVS